MTVKRSYAASVVRRNGAWLIENFDPYGNSDERADAASSLRVAKQIARRFAAEVGYTNFRWEKRNSGCYFLHGIDPLDVENERWTTR